MWWKCEKGHEWQSIIANRTKGIGCPYCSGSRAELYIQKILYNRQIPFEREHIFSEHKLQQYKYDFVSLTCNFVIETDGIQHFESIEFFDKQMSFTKRIQRDNVKNTYCLEKHIALLRIPYTYELNKELKKIVLFFIMTKKVPKEIVDYYAQYKFSNYAEVAKKNNEYFKENH